jgi:hypothetical protein
MLEFSQGVFNDNPHTRQLTVCQFLILSEGMVAPGFVGEKDAMMGQLFMQTLVTGISPSCDLLWDSLGRSGLAKVLQIMD